MTRQEFQSNRERCQLSGVGFVFWKLEGGLGETQREDWHKEESHSEFWTCDGKRFTRTNVTGVVMHRLVRTNVTGVVMHRLVRTKVIGGSIRRLFWRLSSHLCRTDTGELLQIFSLDFTNQLYGWEEKNGVNSAISFIYREPAHMQTSADWPRLSAREESLVVSTTSQNVLLWFFIYSDEGRTWLLHLCISTDPSGSTALYFGLDLSFQPIWART